MRVMGLDLGTKTIGVAVSDAMKSIAQPYTVLRRQNLELDILALEKIIAEKEIASIVIGLPLNMDGSEGSSATMSREFATELEEKTGKKIIFFDERLTTVSAERAMLEGDLSRQKRKGKIDKIAASFILQGYLDSL